MTDQDTSTGASPVVRIWACLVGATLLSGWLADGRLVAPLLAVSAAFAIAAFKARLVVLHYMELRHAPLAWRIAFEAWGVIAAGGILAAHWYVA